MLLVATTLDLNCTKEVLSSALLRAIEAEDRVADLEHQINLLEGKLEREHTQSAQLECQLRRVNCISQLQRSLLQEARRLIRQLKEAPPTVLPSACDSVS